MKEATGELNTTVIVVTAIGLFIAFFYYTLWPIIKGNLNYGANCNKAICEKQPDSNGMVVCHAKGNTAITFKCVYKG